MKNAAIKMFTVTYTGIVPGIVGKIEFPHVSADAAFVLIQTGHHLLNTIFDHSAAKTAERVTVYSRMPMVDKDNIKVGERCLLAIQNGGQVVSSFADGTMRTHMFMDGELTETVDVTTDMALEMVAAQIAAESKRARIKREPVRPEDGKKPAPKKKAPKAAAKSEKTSVAVFEGPSGTGESTIASMTSVQELVYEPAPQAEEVVKEILNVSQTILNGDAAAPAVVIETEEVMIAEKGLPTLVVELPKESSDNVVSMQTARKKSAGPKDRKTAHHSFADALAAMQK